MHEAGNGTSKELLNPRSKSSMAGAGPGVQEIGSREKGPFGDLAKRLLCFSDAELAGAVNVLFWSTNVF